MKKETYEFIAKKGLELVQAVLWGDHETRLRLCSEIEDAAGYKLAAKNSIQETLSSEEVTKPNKKLNQKSNKSK